MRKTLIKPLKILIVESIPSVADLINKRLKRSSFTYTTKLISKRSQFITAVKRGRFDIILSDDDMDLLASRDVLTILKECHDQTPVIVLSKAISSYSTDDLLKNGAFDVVHKENTRQVVKCIERIIAQ